MFFINTWQGCLNVPLNVWATNRPSTFHATNEQRQYAKQTETLKIDSKSQKEVKITLEVLTERLHVHRRQNREKLHLLKYPWTSGQSLRLHHYISPTSYVALFDWYQNIDPEPISTSNGHLLCHINFTQAKCSSRVWRIPERLLICASITQTTL